MTGGSVGGHKPQDNGHATLIDVKSDSVNPSAVASIKQSKPCHSMHGYKPSLSTNSSSSKQVGGIVVGLTQGGGGARVATGPFWVGNGTKSSAVTSTLHANWRSRLHIAYNEK